MHLGNILPINLHRPVTAEVPMFCLVDEALQAQLRPLRWLTAGSPHVVRPLYDKDKGRSVPESLARYVWRTCRVTPPPSLIAHVNGDLLDCRNDNLKAIPYPSLARSSKTGELLKLFFNQNSIVSNAELRTKLGESLEGVAASRGRKPQVSEELIRQLLEARATVACDMSLKAFNAEVCTEIVGTTISPILLSRILSGKTSRIDGYDYSQIKPFRSRS